MLATIDHPNAARLRDLDTALRHREDEERAIHDGQPCDMTALCDEAKRRGFMGPVLIRSGLTRGLPYVASFIDRTGCYLPGETTFSEYATPEAALSALLSTSRAKGGAK